MIDLRSDVLAPPTEAIWRAMREAELGWALVGEDRAVSALEERGAALLGKEAALLLPTCSTANLVALLALAGPGATVLADPSTHVATTEADGLRMIGRFDLRTDGAAAALVLENTHNNLGGRAFSAEETRAAAEGGRRLGAAVHLDGARLLNAAVALGVPACDLAAPADTVAVSLNKGLCAPYGALLAGPRDTLAEARRWAHRLGVGSVHKLGMLAAAGLVALETMVDRLAEDHRRAADLARGLAELPGLRVAPPQTNIVLLDTAPSDLTAPDLVARLREHGVLALARSEHTIRLVTHRGVDDADALAAARAVVAALR